VHSHHDVALIDTTQMYLRTIYELEEEGINPLRARIAERLSQSGPTVSQTVARMERDGLVQVEADRHLRLTDQGRQQAVAVMRKHRLAERLLADVIGLEWDQLHIEACRWEHVMSDAVERRIFEMLNHPLVCPHGNPIPGLDDLGISPERSDKAAGLITLSSCATADATPVTIVRISEQLQPDDQLMRSLSASGVIPGQPVTLTRVDGGIEIVSGIHSTVLPADVTDGIFVSHAD
jgi:DtxR family transcriptional regulator, Mn-dependent transcriptional regulator